MDFEHRDLDTNLFECMNRFDRMNGRIISIPLSSLIMCTVLALKTKCTKIPELASLCKFSYSLRGFQSIHSKIHVLSKKATAVACNHNLTSW